MCRAPWHSDETRKFLHGGELSSTGGSRTNPEKLYFLSRGLEIPRSSFSKYLVIPYTKMLHNLNQSFGSSTPSTYIHHVCMCAQTHTCARTCTRPSASMKLALDEILLPHSCSRNKGFTAVVFSFPVTSG